MPDWADDKAREWLESLGGRLEGPGPISEAYGWLEVSDENAASLAALLRETWEGGLKAGTTQEAEALHRADSLLAEVRRVVEEVAKMHWYEVSGVDAAKDACFSILRRVEKL